MQNNKRSLHTSIVATAVTMASLSLVSSLSSAATIDNAGFESNWTDWNDTDPSAISGDAHSGSKSAKITGSSGRFEQTVSVDSNTNYTLTAYIKGSGKIGAEVGSSDYDQSTSGNDWQPVSVTFNTGNHTSVTVYGAHSGGEGRFDDFSLTANSNGEGGTGGGDSSTDCTGTTDLTIATASDDGSHDGHGPANTIDDDFNTESRWSSNGSGKQLTFDLNDVAKVKALQLAWFKGDQRTSFFDVDTSQDGNNWTAVLVSGQSGGNTTGFESYDLQDSDARYVRVTGYGNTSNSWNSIIEANVRGCTDNSGGSDGGNGGGDTGGGMGNLDPSLPPSGNFELDDWYIGVPIDLDNNGKSDNIYEAALTSGYTHPEWFYTAADGGMVFKAPVDAPKTSTNTSYTRSELREMLRRGNTSVSTQGVNDNNWVFSTYSSSDRNAAGGVDGELKATLKVDHVTSTGSSSQVGRVIIGQIHAKDDEPARLYYRLLPGHSKGSIYLAHEPNGGSDQWYNMIGNRSSSASEPSDGIALGETFSYSIKVDGHTLTVTIMREGKADVVETVNMSGSGYHNSSNQYMYFKAGVYNQNNTGDADDYVQATFYSLTNTHSGYPY